MSQFNLKSFIVIFYCLLGSYSLTYAQSTAEKVYNIFQTNCVACHSGPDASAELQLDGSFTNVMSEIIDATPVNVVAASKGQKLVAPGRPYQSYLLRKIGAYGFLHELDGGFLEPSEGVAMPFYASPLSDSDIELVRQWIYAGAPTNGTIAAEPLIEEYYLDGGVPRMPRPEAPDADKGFQIHLGPIFVAAGDEKEYNFKYELNLPENTEVRRLDTKMNNESHHFIMYKYTNPTLAEITEPGLRVVGFGSGEESPLGSGTDIVASWADSDDIRLPGGTAYFWDNDEVIDLNYHIPNTTSDLVLPSDVYINVYTQASGSAIKEMKTELLNNSFLFIPPGEHTIEEAYYTGSQQLNVWMMGPHTHQLGTDFDVFDLLPDGSPGEQIYEGFYNYTECDCNIGYYDWEHPSNRFFAPYYIIEANSGIYHRATYNNTTGSLVTFGLTTSDEMMITTIQFTVGEAIPFVSISAPADSYCESSAPITLSYMPEGGIFSGSGVVDGLFTPSDAGVGNHIISYTYEGITAEYDIVVTPSIAEEFIINENNEGTLSISEGYDYYQWYLNSNPIFGAQMPSYQANESGLYSVEYASGSCSNTSNVYNFTLVGTPSINTNTPTLSVFPNPYKAFTVINFTLNAPTIVLLDIYSIDGKLISSLERSKLAQGDHQYTFNANKFGLAAGIYTLRLQLNDKIYTKKIVQQ